MQQVAKRNLEVAQPTVMLPDALLAAARQELLMGTCTIDSPTKKGLEAVAKNHNLPVQYRARALSLLCRFG